jgi:hypothetical protein
MRLAIEIDAIIARVSEISTLRDGTLNNWMISHRNGGILRRRS